MASIMKNRSTRFGIILVAVFVSVFGLCSGEDSKCDFFL